MADFAANYKPKMPPSDKGTDADFSVESVLGSDRRFCIYPGRNGSSAPYGSCTAKRLNSVTGWTRDNSELYDYGSVKLNCTVGNTVGWRGRWDQHALMILKGKGSDAIILRV